MCWAAVAAQHNYLKGKQIFQERIAFLFLVVVVFVVIVVAVMVPVAVGVGRRRALRRAAVGAGRPFDDLVEFPAIQPNSPAVGAVIDFYTIAVGHQQIDVTGWTFHA